MNRALLVVTLLVASASLIVSGVSLFSVPRYQVTPWGDSDSVLVVDNQTGEAVIIAQDVGKDYAPNGTWAATSRFNVRTAIATQSTRVVPVPRPDAFTKWGDPLYR